MNCSVCHRTRYPEDRGWLTVLATESGETAAGVYELCPECARDVSAGRGDAETKVTRESTPPRC